jgi:pimeloyl-ACP methyl ester carboxylesterase
MSGPTHHTKEVEGVKWHWVEAGDGEPVVLLHGIPESWQCWKHQIPTLATQFRVLAFDLKGYGQSDKKEGDYTGTNVARELIAVLDSLGIDRFRLAGHDWGAVIGDHICNHIPARIERYMRCSFSLHEYDVRNSLHHQWNSQNPEACSRLMAKPGAFIRVWFESSCGPDTQLSDEEIEEIVAEFSNPGTADAVPRYFRDLRINEPVDYSKFTFPVVVTFGAQDPRQPIEYFRGMEDHIPGLEAILMMDSGHFMTRERPKEMTQALMFFFNSMLAPGVPLFNLSREHGLPVRPVKLLETWGANSFDSRQTRKSRPSKGKKKR